MAAQLAADLARYERVVWVVRFLLHGAVHQHAGNLELLGAFEAELNEVEKLKCETLVREQAALVAAEAEAAAKHLGDIGSTFKTLFSPADHFYSVSESVRTSTKSTTSLVKDSEKAKTPKKRKLEETSTAEAHIPNQKTEIEISVAALKSAKKQKLNKLAPVNISVEPAAAAALATSAATTTTTATQPPTTTALSAAAGPSSALKKLSPLSSPTGLKCSAASAALSIPSAATLAPAPAVPAAPPKTTNTPTPPATQPLSQHYSAAASAEPVSTTVSVAIRKYLCCKSTTPAARTPALEPAWAASATAPTAASCRSKQPAPGPVSSSQEGGMTVSYRHHKVKPAKKKAASQEQGHKESSALKEDIYIDKNDVLKKIDLNEQHYYLCGNISFGIIICCKNTDISII